MSLQKASPAVRAGIVAFALTMACSLNGCIAVVAVAAGSSLAAGAGLYATVKDRNSNGDSVADNNAVPPAERVPPSQQVPQTSQNQSMDMETPRAAAQQPVTVQPLK